MISIIKGDVTILCHSGSLSKPPYYSKYINKSQAMFPNDRTTRFTL